jgi:hypothetical protein
MLSNAWTCDYCDLRLYLGGQIDLLRFPVVSFSQILTVINQLFFISCFLLTIHINMILHHFCSVKNSSRACQSCGGIDIDLDQSQGIAVWTYCVVFLEENWTVSAFGDFVSNEIQRGIGFGYWTAIVAVFWCHGSMHTDHLPDGKGPPVG